MAWALLHFLITPSPKKCSNLFFSFQVSSTVSGEKKNKKFPKFVWGKFFFLAHGIGPFRFFL
jgi:hypothetical protein